MSNEWGSPTRTLTLNAESTSRITRATLSAAAVGCFERYGVHRTSMADVAEAAGVSRQSVYRLFPTRADLLEYIMGQRIEKMAKRLLKVFSEFDNFEDALIEGSIISIQIGQSDALFAEIVAQGGDHRLDQFLLRGSPAVQKRMLELWDGVLDRAREQGRLRPGISNEQAVDWIRSQHALMTIRGDYDEAMQRFVLRTFVLPALCRDK